MSDFDTHQPPQRRTAPTGTAEQYVPTQPASTPSTPPRRDEFTLRIPRLGLGQGPTRAAMKTTEFWMTVGLAVALLLATYVAGALRPVDGWRFITFAVMAYVISRGLAKFGNRSDATYERDGSNNIDIR